MNIWLLTITEPVPFADAAKDRLQRTGAFGRHLASRGHSVVWWASTFDHFRKKQLAPRDTSVTDPSGMKIRLLHGRDYRQNVSIARLLNHIQVARRFSSLSGKEPKPDILVVSLPTVEMCLAAEHYADERRIPVVVDLRDMWPDIFPEELPAALRPISRTLLFPLFRQARRACSSAAALIGITEEFVDWGLERGGRKRSAMDRAFPFTYDPEPSLEADVHAAEAFWDGHGIYAGSHELRVCYFGNFGRQIDLVPVLAAARQLHQAGESVSFALCGDGERMNEYRRVAADLPNVLLPGWMNRAQIQVLMKRSSIGLDPLQERFDFVATINNKAIEYMSAGLPLISSPDRGPLCTLLNQSECGVSYATGDSAKLVQLLSSLNADRDRLKRMGANARALFQNRFHAESVYPAMESYLAEVCRNHRERLDPRSIASPKRVTTRRYA